MVAWRNRFGRIRPLAPFGVPSADNDKSGRYIKAAEPVYKLLGASKNLHWFNHRLGHRYAPEARKRAEEFFDRHLKH